MARKIKGIWNDLYCTFQRLTRQRWQCVPEGRLESRPADLSPVPVFRIVLVPQGPIETSWLKRLNLAKADPRLGHERAIRASFRDAGLMCFRTRR
jgi:hypothetical protein